MGLSLLVVFIIRCRGKNVWKTFISGGRAMWISGLCWTCSGTVFTLGIQYGSSTVTLVMLSLGPLFTALFSWIWIKEKPSPVTFLACFTAVAGVLVMYSDALSSVSVFGLVLAMVLPVITGLNMANLRRNPGTDRMCICMIGGFGSASISFFFCLFQGTFITTGMTIWPLALLGLLVLPVGQVMVSSSSIYLKATQSALINSLESILGILHFLVIWHEVPARNTLIGAIIVLCAIFANAALVPVFQKKKLS